jgi:hypothetical protein
LRNTKGFARSGRSLVLLLPAAACLLPLALRSPGLAIEAQEREAAPAAAGQEVDDLEAAEEDPSRDVERTELPQLPAGARIGSEMAPRSAPFLATHPGGGVTLGCVEWTPGEGDRIELRDAIAQDGTSAPPRRVNEAPLEVVRPVAVADARGRLCVFWTQLAGGRAQIAFAREEKGGGFTAPAVLTSGPLPNANPEAALHADGRVWLAWEGDVAPQGEARSNRDVLVAPLLEEGRLGAAVRVGGGRFSEIDAALVSDGRRLWAAWASFSGTDYEIELRSLDPGSGALGDTIAVSADPAADDLHPALAAAPGGEIWIAWDRVEVFPRGGSLPKSHRPRGSRRTFDVSVRCACVRDGRVLLPGAAGGERAGAVPGAPEMSAGGGMPRLAFDARGRLWIAYRRLDRGSGTISAFPVLLQCLGAKGWSAPLEVGGSAGMLEEAALAPFGDSVLSAGFCDSRARGDDRRNQPGKLREILLAQQIDAPCWYGASAIALASPPPPPPGDAGAPELSERPAATAGRDHPVAAGLDDPILSGASHFEIRRGDERWLVLWGDLHRHSSVSRCSLGREPAPPDRWASGRDVQLCDFMALTDHCSHMDPLAWWQLDKLVWLYASDRFCTLSGFEWSTKKWGHHNVILPDRLFPLVESNMSLKKLYRALPAGRAVTIPHHSAHPRYAVPFDECEDGHSRLIEVYQAMRGSFEFDGCFKQAPTATALGCFALDALQQGRKCGFIASSDHGFGQAFACVLAERLDRESVFEALLARRTYGATSKGILVDFRVNDAVMGEEVEVAEDPRVLLSVRGTADLAEVAVFKNGRELQSIGRRAVLPNRFAPMRLVVRLDAQSAPPERDWKLAVRASEARFGALLDQRRFARGGGVPRWTAEGDRAEFHGPAGYAATAATDQFPLHVFAADDLPLEVLVEGVRKQVWFGELWKRPLKLRAPPAGELTLSLRVGDAGIDLEQGLGTREFAREWVDEESRPGASWYYARVVQVDGEMAWSSPIFVTRRAR